MSVDCSFLLITNQNYYEYAGKVVQSIHDAIKRYPIKYTYEILIYSPYEIPDKNVIWVKDELDKPGNIVYGLNKMFLYSSGDYILLLNDDHILPYPDSVVNSYHDKNEPLKAIEFLKSDIFKDRRFKVTSIGAGSNTHVYGSTCIPSLAYPPPYPLSEELKNPKYTKVPHRHLIMGFPVYERKTVINELRGYLVHPSFKHRYSDNWLPFFLGENGEQIQICLETSVQGIGEHAVQGITTNNNNEQDYYTFCRLVDDFVSGRNKEYV